MQSITAVSEIIYQDSAEQHPGGIAMYTCQSEWWDILITLWQPVPLPNYLPPIREETQ